jgi:hypothetical protein
MDLSFDYTSLWAKFCFWVLRVIFEFSIDGYITRPYWFWSPNSVFGLWELIFNLSTPLSIYFFHRQKISDRLMGHLNYLIYEPRIWWISIIFGLRKLNFKFKIFCVFRFLKFGFVLALGLRQLAPSLRELNCHFLSLFTLNEKISIKSKQSTLYKNSFHETQNQL